MAAFKVKAEPSFRKETFTSKLVESGIKLFGDGDKAVLKAYLSFEDDPKNVLSYFLYDKKGKSVFETKSDGTVKTKNYGIGQVIEFMLEKKSIESFIDLEPGHEKWWFGKIDEPEKNIAVGLNWTMQAYTPKIKDEHGGETEGYTNFTLVKVEADTANASDKKAEPVSPKQEKKSDKPSDDSIASWKAFIKTLKLPMKEKEINAAVVAHAKAQGKTPEQIGLSDRRKNLDALEDDLFIEKNEDGQYVLVPE